MIIIRSKIESCVRVQRLPMFLVGLYLVDRK